MYLAITEPLSCRSSSSVTSTRLKEAWGVPSETIAIHHPALDWHCRLALRLTGPSLWGGSRHGSELLHRADFGSPVLKPLPDRNLVSIEELRRPPEFPWFSTRRLTLRSQLLRSSRIAIAVHAGRPRFFSHRWLLTTTSRLLPSDGRTPDLACCFVHPGWSP